MLKTENNISVFMKIVYAYIHVN